MGMLAKEAWIWLVKAPGVKRPAIEEQPMYLANLRTARWAWAAGDHIDVLWFLNSSNGPGGKNQLL